MKWFITGTTLIATLFISCSNVLAMSPVNVYLENHYGATIKFKAGIANGTGEETAIPHLARELVGTCPGITSLSIRTTGTGSRFVSYFTELSNELEQIRLSRFSNKDKNAIIIIKPSRSYQSWDIEVRWETSDRHIEEFEKDFNEFEAAFKEREEKKRIEEMKAFAEQTRLFAQEQRKAQPLAPSEDFFFTEKMLTEIMLGALGDDYAKKARAINDYDYTKATQKGLQNLRTHLLKRIDETFKQTYTRESRRQKRWITPSLATEQELKDNIDMLYRSLQRYKS